MNLYMSQIITIDDLSTYMTKTTIDPGLGQQVVDAINTFIESRTGRVWGETKQIVERYNWKRNLWLRHPDVVTVDKLALGWPGHVQSILDPNGYFVNSLGRLSIIWQFQSNMSGGSSPLYNDYMEVTYTYGVPVVPDDLTLAVLGIAGAFYNYSINGQQDVVASSVGSYRVQFAGSVRAAAGVPDPAKSTADANWQVVDSYRMRRV